MVRFASASAVCIVFGFGTLAPAADPEKPADRAKALIDKLTELDRQDTGYSGSDSGSAFLPLNRSEPGALLLSPRKGKFGSADTMKSLVKLGVDAVPQLLRHLDDDRKTKIVIDCKGMMGAPKDPKYKVQVGDLCYVALGQIVNRDYTAVKYIPTAIVAIADVPKNKKLREDLAREWGNLTAESHQKSLAKDLDSGYWGMRNAASVRLAYYYPDALEAHILKQFARPAYDRDAVEDCLRRKLYPAATAKERKELVVEFVKKHGEIARDGIRWQLFHDLDWADVHDKAQECLIDVFGFTDKVTTKDRPKEQPLSDWDQGMFIDSLRYDRSAKIDRVIRDWMAKTDDDFMGFRCLSRLVGRGYDDDIAAYIKRRMPLTEERYQKSLKEYEAKIGWTWLHKTVELGVPELIETALKEKLDVNAKAKDGRTALHLAADSGNADIVKLLLDAKADRGAKDEIGHTPLEIAKERKHTAVVRLLEQKK